MAAVPSSVFCQRKLYVFACKCRYLSPRPCTCCPQLQAPMKATLALPFRPDMRVQTAKRTNLRMECPQHQLMGIELKLELARSTYQETLDLWGEWDEDAAQQYKEYSKANRDYERLSKAIKRDSPNVDGWELLE